MTVQIFPDSYTIVINKLGTSTTESFSIDHYIPSGSTNTLAFQQDGAITSSTNPSPSLTTRGLRFKNNPTHQIKSPIAGGIWFVNSDASVSSTLCRFQNRFVTAMEIKATGSLDVKGNQKVNRVQCKNGEITLFSRNKLLMNKGVSQGGTFFYSDPSPSLGKPPFFRCSYFNKTTSVSQKALTLDYISNEQNVVTYQSNFILGQHLRIPPGKKLGINKQSLDVNISADTVSKLIEFVAPGSMRPIRLGQGGDINGISLTSGDIIMPPDSHLKLSSATYFVYNSALSQVQLYVNGILKRSWS